MSTVVHGSHSGGAGHLNLMSCVRESSPLDEYEPDTEKNVVSKRKFWNPKKWFRKKLKTNDDVPTQEIQQHHQEQEGGARSRSASELSVDEDRRDEERHPSSMHPGLSVSHDSVFHPLNSGSSDLELDGAHSSSSLSISQPLGDAKLQSELSSRLRLRRGREDTSEDDEGLPRSPLCGSPAAATDSYLILEKTANKDLPTKSHSTCSDGSLLSMDDSSEIEEDSIGIYSRHSSKISLHEKRTDQDSDLELGPSFTIQHLNHSAAHHRVSVRPKRTYGAPRRKKGQLSSALPATPEVNEDSSVRSTSPEVSSREQLTQLYSSTTLTSTSNVNSNLTSVTENKLKSFSLPVGVTLPTSESFRLKKSKLQTSGRSHDDTSVFEEEKEEKLSFFERIFPRRSGKAKKREEVVKSEEKTVHTSTKSYYESSSSTSHTHSHSKNETVKPTVAPRSTAASRQRVQPIDIPMPSRDANDSGVVLSVDKPHSPDNSLFGSSPIQAELENILKQRMSHQKPSSPLLSTPPISPRSPKRHVTSKIEHSSYASRQTHQEEFKTSNLQSNPFGLKSYNQEAKKSSREELNCSIFSDTRLNHVPDDTLFVNRLHSIKTTPEVFERLDNENNMQTEEIEAPTHTDIIFSSRIGHKESEINRSKVKIAALSPLQQRVLNLNEEDGFKSLTEFPIKPIKSVTKSHSFKSKNEEKPSEDEKIFDRKKSLKAASLDSVQNIEDNISSKDLIGENNNIDQIEIGNEKIELEAVPNDSITISGPSHTAVVNVTSSKDFHSAKTTTHSEDETKKIVKESNVSVTKIHLKHEQTQVTRNSITVPKNEVPEFLNKQLNKVEIKNEPNVIFSMKSPKITSNDDVDTKYFFELSKEHSKNHDHQEPPKILEETPKITRPKPVFSRGNSKEIDTQEKNHPVILRANSKENLIDNDEKPLPRPKTLFNFPLGDQETASKSIFLRSTSRDDTSPKDSLPPRPKTLFNFNQNSELDSTKPVVVRSISKESASSESSREAPKTPPFVTVTPLTPTQGPKYKKNEVKPSSRKSSIVNSPNSELNKSKSVSLDSLRSGKIDSSDKSSQDSLDKKSSQDSLDKRSPTEGVVLRRKSTHKKKEDDQPELMKVFARRSLKLKDEDIAVLQENLNEQKLRDSDKENASDSAVDILDTKEQKTQEEKKPLVETRKISDYVKNIANEEPEVQLRRTFNHNIFLNQRAQSLNPPRNVTTDHGLKKQVSLKDNRKTDNWVTVKKSEETSEIIEETKTETKNFSQRKAEWEKRVQQFKK